MCISPCRDELEEKEERHEFYDNKAADLEANEETKQTSFWEEQMNTVLQHKSLSLSGNYATVKSNS